MKAITLHEPWASLVIWGEKKFETRSWSTSYRGRIAIHAGKRWTAAQAALLYQFPFDGTFVGTPLPLPLGCVLGVCELVAVHRTEDLLDLTPIEDAFGDFSNGRYAWEMRVIHRFETPIPAKGFQQLWDWEPPQEVVLPAPRQKLVQLRLWSS